MFTSAFETYLTKVQTDYRRGIATDRAIDALVYQLYGLTDAEVKNCRRRVKPFHP